MDDSYPFRFAKNKIRSKASVSLLGIEIDNELKFDYHVSSVQKSQWSVGCIKQNTTLYGLKRTRY